MGEFEHFQPREKIYFTTILGGKIVKIEGERAKNSRDKSFLSLSQLKKGRRQDS